MTVTGQLAEAADPTPMTCSVCGAEYSLNSPRVRRSLTALHRLMVWTGAEQIPAEHETARLCWVCTRLHHSVQAEAGASRQL